MMVTMVHPPPHCREVSAPAKALLAVAIVQFFLAVLSAAWRLYTWVVMQDVMGSFATGPPIELALFGGFSMAQESVQLTAMFITALGAWKMLRLESYGMALTSAILMTLPWMSPCCVLGLPFGIWALVVLNREEVRGAFRSFAEDR